MKITWLGHACFKIEKDDFTIIIDPFSDGYVPGLDNIREKANLVLCSHEHSDHNARDIITMVDGVENPFDIKMINTYHDDVKGEKRGPNKIHILKAEGKKIVHFGDLGCMLTDEQIDNVKNADVIMIPIGGFYTITSKQAAEIVKKINPKVVIPMHYRSDKYDYGYEILETVNNFNDNVHSLVRINRDHIEVGETLPSQVVALHPYYSFK